MLPLVVYSHLRWNFVFQRPQQLMSRFARDQTVLFIEEPVRDPGDPRLVESRPLSNLRVLTPHTPLASSGFADEQVELLHPLLRRYAREQGLGETITWFYTPMALHLMDTFESALVVFDCMDHLAGFLGAPPALAARERLLLRIADVVFTGGPSLQRAKLAHASHALCFPSSVDAAHFARATDASEALPALAALPRPRIGFFGVLDERLDLDLLAALADARPDWQWLMVGPVVKIDPASLPRRANLHYFGPQAYADLPRHLAAWDLCMMPFARNAATRYISPTKTLEYFAAGLPVVSTAIADVVEPYGHLVGVANDAGGFVNACAALLAETGEARAARRTGMAQVVAATGWDDTVRRMRVSIGAALSRQRRVQAREQAARRAALARLPTHGLSSAAVGGT